MEKMKSLYTLLLSLLSVISFAQNSGNPHFFKVIIQNEQKEILLIKYEGAWEVPGSRYKGSKIITEFVEDMGQKHGVVIDDIQLKALITFHYEIRDYPTMMFYFKAEYKSGELIIPSWGEDVAWFSLEKAYEVIPFPEMNYILKNLSETDLLQGAFKITYDTKSKERIGFEIIQDLTKMN